jgi:hypothetical protein
MCTHAHIHIHVQSVCGIAVLNLATGDKSDGVAEGCVTFIEIPESAAGIYTRSHVRECLCAAGSHAISYALAHVPRDTAEHVCTKQQKNVAFIDIPQLACA